MSYFQIRHENEIVASDLMSIKQRYIETKQLADRGFWVPARRMSLWSASWASVISLTGMRDLDWSGTCSTNKANLTYFFPKCRVSKKTDKFKYRWTEAVHLGSDGADPPELVLMLLLVIPQSRLVGEQLLWLHPPLPTPSTGSASW